MVDGQAGPCMGRCMGVLHGCMGGGGVVMLCGGYNAAGCKTFSPRINKVTNQPWWQSGLIHQAHISQILGVFYTQFIISYKFCKILNCQHTKQSWDHKFRNCELLGDLKN